MQISSPLNFIEADLTKNLTLAIDNFRPIFLEIKDRPNFNGKFIFFDMSKTKGILSFPYPEKLMHIMSLEPKNSHTIYPCNNDIAFSYCQNQCDASCANTHFKLLLRNECYYRIARIHWIPEIIHLANTSNPSVQIWIEKNTNGRRKTSEKTYIRYQEGIVDYVIILRHVMNKDGSFSHYALISAFPVFLKRNKTQFSQAYQAFISTTSDAQNTAV